MSSRLGRSALPFALILGLLGAVGLEGQTPVPSFRDVTGFELGERITLHHQMVRYLETLERTSDRVRVLNQGRSYERNELLVAVVTSPGNHARLDEIQRRAQRLGDPRNLADNEAARLVEDQPAIVWLGGSIHGFELPGTEGLLRILERLTTTSDLETLEVLEQVVVLVDPMLNPDGRDAHARHNHENLGRIVASARDDWSNDFSPWEGLKYRTSHYYHDLNRDWFIHSHPETRLRVGTVQSWRPQVLVDAHEMGADVEFYFDPPTGPWAPHFPEFGRWGFDLFNRGCTEAFDREGYEYMTGERYNYFYPGYTTSWGSYQGAVGMLYEQGSTRGLAMTRADGSVRTLRDALDQQYTAAWAALVTSTRHREELLTRYVAAHRAAVEAGTRGIRRYLVPPNAGDPHLLREFLNALHRNGIEIHRLAADVTLSGVRDREENPRFYDVTAYSLPLYFNLEVFGSSDGRSVEAVPLENEVEAPANPSGEAGYAYLLDGWNARSLTVATHLKERGYRAAFSTVPLVVQGDTLPSGTLVVRVGQNPSSIHASVRELADRYGVGIRLADSGATDTGYPALGSADVFPLHPPSVALVAEAPVNGLSFGFAWHALDQFYHVPTTVLRAGSLAGADLRRFNVVVLPEVNGSALDALLGEAGRENLRAWVRQGGTLVALGSAVDFVAGPLGLVSLASWYDTEAGKGAAAYDVPGAFFRVELDRSSWLTAGIPAGDLPVQIRSSRLYLDPGLPPSSTRRPVGHLVSENAHLAGHAWPESMERLPGTAFAWEERVGAGRVIALTEDINFRSYARGTQRLFLNAVILGPSAP